MVGKKMLKRTAKATRSRSRDIIIKTIQEELSKV